MATRTPETAGFLAAPDGSSIYACAYEPEGAAWRSPVLIVPGDGEERTWSQRTLVNLARFLARRGHPVVRFDFRGQGESDRAYEDTDLETRIADLGAVAERTASCYGAAPWLVGVRLGASLAMRWAARGEGPAAGVVAIEPVDSGETLLGEVLRKNIANQLVIHKKVVLNRKELRERIVAGEPVSCNGFLIARPFLESLATFESAPDRAACPNLSVLRLSSGSTAAGELAVSEPPFWIEAPTVRTSPQALFDAVAGRLPETLVPSPSGMALAAAAVDGRRALSIEATDGRVAATWYAPSSEGSTSFLFLNPGPNDRAGPHGLYVRLAAALASRGYGVLRIDSHGVGESDGDDDRWQGRPASEFHREINHGAMVPAAVAALHWLDRHGPGRRVLFGLCGGASNAVLTGAAERRADLDLILLGTPVLHLGVGVEGAALTPEALDEEVRVLGQKLVDPAYLWRLVTFRSDYAHLLRLARSRAKAFFRSEANRSRRSGDAPLHPQTNERFLDAWELYSRRGGETTFVFSEHDRLYGQFRDQFAPLVRDGGLPANARVVVLEGANHNVTDPAAERRLLACLVEAVGRKGAR